MGKWIIPSQCLRTTCHTGGTKHVSSLLNFNFNSSVKHFYEGKVFVSDIELKYLSNELPSQSLEYNRSWMKSAFGKSLIFIVAGWWRTWQSCTFKLSRLIYFIKYIFAILMFVEIFMTLWKASLNEVLLIASNCQRENHSHWNAIKVFILF